MQEKSNKKLKIDETVEDASSNNQVDTISKVKLAPLKALVIPIIKSFANGILSFDTFKHEMEKMHQYAETQAHILLAFQEVLVLHQKKPSKQKEYEELVFGWFLDQVESKITDLKAHYAGSPTKRMQAENLILLIATYYTQYDKISARPLLKQWIIDEFLLKLVLQLLASSAPESKNLLEFINKHFPTTGIDLLKKYTSDSSVKKSFMDLLLQGFHYEHILSFWNAGFRPYSQEEFNTKLFDNSYISNNSITTQTSKFTQLEELYETIFSTEAYAAFLKFSDLEMANVLFVKNAAVSKELYVKLQARLGLPGIKLPVLNEYCLYNEAEARLMFEVNKSSQFLEKKLYLITSAGSLADAKAIRELKLDSVFGDRFARSFSYDFLLDTPKFRKLKPKLNFELELFYNLLLPIITLGSKDTGRKLESSITNMRTLFDYFKAKNISPLQLAKLILYFQLSVLVLKESYNNELFKEMVIHIYKDLSTKEIRELCKKYSTIPEEYLATYAPERIARTSYLNDMVVFCSTLLSQAPTEVKAELFNKPNSAIIKSMAKFIQHSWKIQTNFGTQHHQVSDLITGTFTVLKTIDTTHDFVPKFIVKLLGHYNNLAYSIKYIILDQLDKECKDWVRYLSDTNDILSLLLAQLSTNSLIDLVIRDINFIMDLIANNSNYKLPKSFLNNLTPLTLNESLRSKFNEQAIAFIEELDNKCIHLAKITGQEKEYEEIKTEYLIKFNVDPSKDPQAIHAAANHDCADKIYKDWMALIGNEQDTETQQKLKIGLKFVSDHLKNESLKEYMKGIESISDINLLKQAFPAFTGIGTMPDNPDLLKAIEPFNQRKKISEYVNSLARKSNMTPSTRMEIIEKQDAKKLLHIIGLVGYFARPESTSDIFADKDEAIKIFAAEMKDQVENPSCNQGPFIRFLMALEVVCPSIKFPRINKRTIVFTINDFINHRYDAMNQDEKENLIKHIHTLVLEDAPNCKKLEDVFPEKSFTRLIALFMESNQDRLQMFSEKDITNYFTYGHPINFHPKIAQDINNYMQQPQKSVHQGARNTFFEESSKSNNNNVINNNPQLK